MGDHLFQYPVSHSFPMAKLVFALDDGQVITVPVAGHMTVGSEEGNDVVVEEPSIGAHHAEIVPTASGGYSIRDLGSASGTRVNGSAVTLRDLSDGDEILFGILRGRFLLDDDPKPDPYAADINDGQRAETEEKLRELNASYHDLHAKHQMVLGMVSTLGAQEKQKLASLERLHSDIEELEGKILTARESLKHGEEALSSTNALLEKTQSTRDQLSAEVTGLQSTRDQLKDDLAALAKLRAEAEASFRKCEDDLLTAASALGEKQALHAKLEKSVGNLQSKHAELEAAITVLNQRSESAEKSLQARELESEELNKSLADLRLRKAEAQEETEKLLLEQRRLEEKTVGLAEQERQLHETQEALEKAAADLASTTTLLNDTRESLSQTRSQSVALSVEKVRLEKELSRINEALQLSIAETKRQQAEHEALIGERTDALQTLTQQLVATQSLHTELQQGIESATSQKLGLEQTVLGLASTVQSYTEEIGNLTTQRQELTSQVQGLTEAVTAEEARLTEMRNLADEWEAHIHRFAHEFQELEGRHNDLEVRVAKLQGTEDQLLQAKHQLEETTKNHAALSAALAALDSSHGERQMEVAALETAIADLTQRRASAADEFASEQKKLESFKASSAELQKRTTAEQAAVDAALQSTKDQLSHATAKLQTAIATHDELERQNAKLDDVRAMLMHAESACAALDAKNNALESQAAGLDSTLKTLRTDTDATSTRLDALRRDETELKQKRQELVEQERTERRRFEELRQLNMDVENAGKALKVELDAELEARRRETAVVERQLLEMCVARDDLDRRYAVLATMPEDSPEALKLWHEIQKLKEETAEKLPGGIKPRANARTTVVPRNRG